MIDRAIVSSVETSWKKTKLEKTRPICDFEMSNFVIRAATPEDLPTILNLIHLKAEFDGCPDAVMATAERLDHDLFRAHLASVLLVSIDQEIAGFATYHRIYSTFLAKPGIWLDDLYLKPEFRGHGMGWALMQHLCQIAQTAGCERIDWTVAVNNAIGIQFYTKVGATINEAVKLCRFDKTAIEHHASQSSDV